jgi:hypothetical protein
MRREVFYMCEISASAPKDTAARLVRALITRYKPDCISSQTLLSIFNAMPTPNLAVKIIAINSISHVKCETISVLQQSSRPDEPKGGGWKYGSANNQVQHVRR